MTDSKYFKRTVVKEEIPSDELDAIRKTRIFLPPGYDERIQYPAIYCQDGEEFFNFGRIATHATKMILDDHQAPFIIVGVEVDAANRTAQYAPEGDQFQSYCRFFIEEMLPYVEERYAVTPSSQGRVLAGDSLGATVSLHLALDRPDLFTKVLALSGAFLQSTQQRIEQASDLAWLKLYQLIGTEETEVSTGRGTFNFLEANQKTRQLLAGRKANLHYVEKSGVHLWGFWQQELPEGMKYLLQDTPE
jgi:enterochelin esterase-like enzyme